MEKNRENNSIPPKGSAFYIENEENLTCFTIQDSSPSPIYKKVKDDLYKQIITKYMFHTSQNYETLPRAPAMKNLIDFGIECLDKYYDARNNPFNDVMHAQLDVYLSTIIFLRKFAINKFIYLLKLDINKFADEDKKEDLFRRCNYLLDSLRLFFIEYVITSHHNFDTGFLRNIYMFTYKIVIEISDFLINKIAINLELTSGLKEVAFKMASIVDVILKDYNPENENSLPSILDIGEGYLLLIHKYLESMDKIYAAIK